VYYNWVKFHKNSIGSLVGVALAKYMDGQGDSYIPHQTLFAGGIINLVSRGFLCDNCLTHQLGAPIMRVLEFFASNIEIT
jgi:hypothetical protein